MSLVWKGQYEQCNKWHTIKFDHFAAQLGAGGLIKGGGSDDAGVFTIEGSFAYDNPTCRFIKKYPAHCIYYEGTYNQAEKLIDGYWGF